MPPASDIGVREDERVKIKLFNHRLEASASGNVRDRTATDGTRLRLQIGALTVQARRLPPSAKDRRVRGDINEAINKATRDGMKQYRFGKLPLFDAYTRVHASSDDAPEPSLRAEVGRGAYNVVTRRANPHATVYSKRSMSMPAGVPFENPLQSFRDQGTKLNELHALMYEDAAVPYRGHFAVEVLEKIEHGQAKFLTPIVRGETLSALAFVPDSGSRAFPASQRQQAFEDLRQALRWLHENGMTHGDIHGQGRAGGNVLWDGSKLVLIDWQLAGSRNDHRDTWHGHTSADLSDLDRLEAWIAQKLAAQDALGKSSQQAEPV